MTSGARVRLRRLADERVALASFAVVEAAAIPLLLWFGNRWWFWDDDWDFLATRTGGNFADLFRAHYQHWTTLPILAYRLLWWLFGIRTYVPYQLLVVVGHLTVAALLRVVMRRAGVGPWIATITAGAFVFFGSGAENILIAFQITFVGSFVFGLGQMLLADHDGPVDRRDWLALLAGFAGLLCSGVAVTMTIIVGIAMLLRRGWRVALLQTVPLAVAYLVWTSVAPEGQGAGVYRTQSPVQVVKFIAIGIGSAFGRLGQVPGLGIVLAMMLMVGLVLVFRAHGRGALRGRLAVPMALFAGAIVFLVVTGVVRSGQSGPLANALGVGPERARQSRYVYLAAAMLLPALALAADAIVRSRRALAIPVAALLLVGVPGNVHQLRIYTDQSLLDRQRFRTEVLEAPRLPLARELPADLPAGPPDWTFYGLTLGWLVDSLPTGRIPAPGRFTPTETANLTLRLALRPAISPRFAPCRVLRRPEEFVLGKRERITLKSGSATITYLPDGSAASDPMPFVTTNLVSVVGSLRIRITPASGPAEVCG